MRGIGIVILAVFYGVYIVKMILQRRKGIRTDQIARGKPRGRLFWTELTMKIATYLAAAAEVISIFAVEPVLPRAVVLCGAALGLAGDLVFAAAVVTMRDSWRAGIAEQDKTELITQGIYQISRNPAFLGFDCVYIGLALMFFNVPLLACSLFAVVMLHLQTLQEEQYLEQAFGGAYVRYREKVHRYLGRRR